MKEHGTYIYRVFDLKMARLRHAGGPVLSGTFCILTFHCLCVFL